MKTFVVSTPVAQTVVVVMVAKQASEVTHVVKMDVVQMLRTIVNR